MKTQLLIAVFLILTIGTSLTRAADTEWTGAADNNFFNDANWTGAAPGSTNDHAFIEGGQNLPATIAADIGTVEIGAVSLGLFDGGSNWSASITGWFSDPKYTGPYGIPLELPYEAAQSDSPSFTGLVKEYSGDMAPRQMLNQLLDKEQVNTDVYTEQ